MHRLWISCRLPAAVLALGLASAGCVSTRLDLAPDHPARVASSPSAGTGPAAVLRGEASIFDTAAGTAVSEGAAEHGRGAVAPPPAATGGHEHH